MGRDVAAPVLRLPDGCWSAPYGMSARTSLRFSLVAEVDREKVVGAVRRFADFRSVGQEPRADFAQGIKELPLVFYGKILGAHTVVQGTFRVPDEAVQLLSLIRVKKKDRMEGNTVLELAEEPRDVFVISDPHAVPTEVDTGVPRAPNQELDTDGTHLWFRTVWLFPKRNTSCASHAL